jgi:hypothetical protein
MFSKLPPAPVDPPGPFYTVILIFFISAALGFAGGQPWPWHTWELELMARQLLLLMLIIIIVINLTNIYIYNYHC